jgi:dipeptidyl aminopeptidase/acylaminoacyl peptidase
MTAHRDVHLFLRAHFDVTADASVLDGQIDAVLTATASRRQQPAWLAALRSHPMSTTARSFGRPLSAPAWVLLIILALLIAITAVGVTTGTFRLPPAPIVNGPIVFGRFVPAADDTAVFLVRPDGSGEHLVIPAPIECPQLSPDGGRIAIAFGVVNVDGTDRRMFPATFAGATLGCNTWSPDGRRLAVEGFNDADRTLNGIYLADAEDGGNVVRLTTNGQDGNDIPGDWSPDGKHIAFNRGIGTDRSELWVVDVDTGDAYQVIPHLISGTASWSPDGQWLITGRALEQGQVSQFIVVRPDGSDLWTISLPANHNWATGATFSPDGTRLAFNMAVGTSDNADIYTMKINGADVVQITNTPNENEYFVDWGIDPR